MPEGKKRSVPEAPRLTGLKKRQQIELAGRAMFIWVAVAAVALSFCIATGQYLFTKWEHNNKVLDAKYKASSTLTGNIENASNLKEEVDSLVASQPLASVKTNPADPNTKSVLDALPTSYDPAALATSLQQAVFSRSGVTIESISLPPEVAGTSSSSTSGQTATSASAPQEIKFSFAVSGSYDKIRAVMADMERTIRPIKITSISLTGTDTELRALCEAVTYYQPPKTVDTQTETIQ